MTGDEIRNNYRSSKGGWLPESRLDEGIEYASLSDCALNDLGINYWESYRTDYFYDRIIPNQGIEEILGALKQTSGTPERWLDLGAAVTTLVWATSVTPTKLKSIDVCDISPEALFVLKRFKEGNEIPNFYCRIMERSIECWKNFLTIRFKTWRYHVFDCFKPWPSQITFETFDLITVIGCFGLNEDKVSYGKSFEFAAERLSKNGVIFGVDWVRSKTFVNEEGHDNRYLDPELIIECASRKGLNCKHLESVKIENDPNYDFLFIWTFAAS